MPIAMKNSNAQLRQIRNEKMPKYTCSPNGTNSKSKKKQTQIPLKTRSTPELVSQKEQIGVVTTDNHPTTIALLNCHYGTNNRNQKSLFKQISSINNTTKEYAQGRARDNITFCRQQKPKRPPKKNCQQITRKSIKHSDEDAKNKRNSRNEVRYALFLYFNLFD